MGGLTRPDERAHPDYSLVMVLLVAALSASILPPAPLLVAVLVGMGLLLPLLWKRFVRLHSRLQIALMETLEEEGGE